MTTKTRILLFGKNGQLGYQLQQSLANIGKIYAYDRENCDLTNFDALDIIIENINPNIIINAAAYTSVDKAEEEPLLAHRINSEAVAIMAEFAKKRDALLVHYSTDYVFDGLKSSPYIESDIAIPLSVYGRSKLSSEVVVQKINCKHLIFRISWLFSVRGSNFLKTILKLAKEKDSIKVVDDQYGAPTSVKLVADLTGLAIRQWLTNPKEQSNLTGLYHLTSMGETSWYGYAKHIIDVASSLGITLRCKSEEVQAIKSEDHFMKAKRPASSRLDNSKFISTFGGQLPCWQDHVSYVIKKISEIIKTQNILS